MSRSMSPTYVLHYAPDNASLIIRLALDELGQPCQTALVDRSVRQQDSAAFRALNPAGLIPVLETPQGPIAETGAILLWLSERHGAMAPAAGDPSRGAFLRALFFVANTLHADLRLVFYPEKYVGSDGGAQAALHAGVTARLRQHYAQLDTLAGAGLGWFGTEGVSVLDLYVAVTLRWAQLYARLDTGWFVLADHPNLHALAARIEARPSMQRAILAEGLGDTPLTAPRPCTPPEGSALG